MLRLLTLLVGRNRRPGGLHPGGEGAESGPRSREATAVADRDPFQLRQKGAAPIREVSRPSVRYTLI